MINGTLKSEIKYSYDSKTELGLAVNKIGRIFLIDWSNTSSFFTYRKRYIVYLIVYNKWASIWSKRKFIRELERLRVNRKNIKFS